MSMLCIGGICIPYSAFWPLLLLLLKPVLQYMFPNFYIKKKKEEGNSETNSMKISTEEKDTVPNKVYKDNEIIYVESESEFSTLLKTSTLLIIKFTATWCKPCHAIQPVYEELAKSYTRIRFVVIDIDKLENIASEWDALRIPYFVSVKNGVKIDAAVTTSKDKLLEMTQVLLS